MAIMDIITNMHTTLCLQISDGFQCVMTPIMHLPLCPRYWEINYPNIIDNIKINGRFNPKLSVYWPDFIVRNLNTFGIGVVAGTYSNISVVVGAVLTGLYKVIAAANIRNL
jgi:hypothetical protein